MDNVSSRPDSRCSISSFEDIGEKRAVRLLSENDQVISQVSQEVFLEVPANNSAEALKENGDRRKGKKVTLSIADKADAVAPVKRWPQLGSATNPSFNDITPRFRAPLSNKFESGSPKRTKTAYLTQISNVIQMIAIAFLCQRVVKAI